MSHASESKCTTACPLSATRHSLISPYSAHCRRRSRSTAAGAGLVVSCANWRCGEGSSSRSRTPGSGLLWNTGWHSAASALSLELDRG